MELPIRDKYPSIVIDVWKIEIKDADAYAMNTYPFYKELVINERIKFLIHQDLAAFVTIGKYCYWYSEGRYLIIKMMEIENTKSETLKSGDKIPSYESFKDGDVETDPTPKSQPLKNIRKYNHCFTDLVQLEQACRLYGLDRITTDEAVYLMDGIWNTMNKGYYIAKRESRGGICTG